MDLDDRLVYAAMSTRVLRPPRQTLSTFGGTTVAYYMLTRPVYDEVVADAHDETVVREGKVVAEKPQVVTPAYMLNVDGFSPEARRYFQNIVREEGPASAGLLYRYRNEPGDTNIISEPLQQVAQKLMEKLDSEGAQLSAVIAGVDELWDVSLLKFIHELVYRSARQNVQDLGSLLEVDREGLPGDARQRIERMFEAVRTGQAQPADLRAELQRWNMWEQYQDRFFALFRPGGRA